MQSIFYSSPARARDVKAAQKQLKPYLERLQAVSSSKEYAIPESSIHLPKDEQLLHTVLTMKARVVSKKLKRIVVVGIGGSSLGAKAVYDALFGSTDLLEPDRFPKIIFLDTLDQNYFARLVKFLSRASSSEEILVNIVSKSGSTLETKMNAELLIAALGRRWKDIDRRIVTTTDFESPLWRNGEEKDMELLSQPECVGGRYSVMTAVGLFPLASAGVNVKKLRQGARSVSIHGAAQSASVIFSHYKQRRHIHNLFLFEPALASLGAWHRQLMAESLGKNGKGILPIVSIGTTDLHSMAQLYLGGPNEEFTTFVSAEKNMIRARAAIFEGVKAAYKKKKRPFMEISLPDLTERSLGAFMQFKMIETMCLGFLMDVNAFDQPEVELYKQETRKRL